MKLRAFIKNNLIVESINDKNILKAIFLAGSPGAGKTTLAKKAFGIDNNNIAPGGMKFVSSDSIYERKGGPKKMDFNNVEVSKKYGQAQDLSQSQYENLMDNYNSMVIDGTGRNLDVIREKKKILEEDGYTVYMIFVNAPLHESMERNRSRERVLKDVIVSGTSVEARKNLDKFRAMFGNRFFLVDNSDERTAREKELLDKKNEELKAIKGDPDFKKKALAIESKFRSNKTLETELKQIANKINSEKISSEQLKKAKSARTLELSDFFKGI